MTAFGAQTRRIFEVRRRPGNPAQGIVSAAGRSWPCALGKGGVRGFKREGDGATPAGDLQVLYGWFRRDGIVSRRTPLPLVPIHGDDGWCDAPADRNYNRPVRLPYAASHERLRRDDRLYDICVVLDWNVRQRRRNLGSAIFLHLARPGYKPTEGCIAVSAATMREILPLLRRGTVFRVRF